MRTTTFSSKDEILAVKEESQDSRPRDNFFERQGSYSKRRDSHDGQSIGFGGRDSGVGSVTRYGRRYNFFRRDSYGERGKLVRWTRHSLSRTKLVRYTIHSRWTTKQSSDEIPTVKEKIRAVADNTLSSDGKINRASQPPYCSNQTCA